MTKVKNVLDKLLEKYPLELSSSFDTGKLGLQFGNPDDEVKGILITLDVTSMVIDEAIKKGYHLIISHHSMLFNPIINLDYRTPIAQKIKKILTNNINIISMHTNFDVAADGMNDILAEMLELKNIVNPDGIITKDSFVRIGYVDNIKASELVKMVQEKWLCHNVRTVGNLDKIVSKVGLVGGGGAFEMYEAIDLGCDVYISGEFRHNNALDALDAGIILIEVDHAVEANFRNTVKNYLVNNFNDIPINLSDARQNPFN